MARSGFGESQKTIVQAIPHLRERIKGFEADQQRTFEHFDQLEQAHRELFESQRSARVCRDEIAALRQALSHTSVKYAFDEREQLLKLQANHDQLRIRCAENRYFIQNLLDLTESAAERKDEGIFRDRRPGRARENTQTQGRAAAAARGGRKSGKGAPATQMVYLHADREQILADAVGSLQRFVDGKTELQQLRLAQLRADKGEREQATRANVDEHHKRIGSHKEWLLRVERRLTAVTRDYLRLRRESLAEANGGKEERERLKAFTSSVQSELKREERNMEKQAMMTLSGGGGGGPGGSLSQHGHGVGGGAISNGDARAVVRGEQTFQQQLVSRIGARDAELHTLRERCESNQQEYTARIEKLTAAITATRQQTRRMHRLRDSEFAYFTGQVGEVRGLVRRAQSAAVAASLRRPASGAESAASSRAASRRAGVRGGRASSRRSRSRRAAAAATAIAEDPQIAPAALQARILALQRALAGLK
jgi:hypothetical protein